MKILHVAPSFHPARFYGGPIESVYSLCRHLVQQGCDVKVLTTDSNGLDQVLDLDKDREVILAGNVCVRYCRRLARHSVSFELLRRLVQYVRWADVVHLTAVYSFPTIPTLMACRILGKPLVWSPRGALQRWPGSQKVGRKKIWESICALAAPRDFILHVTSDQEAKESRSAFPRAQTYVIANGVEISGRANDRSAPDRLRLVFLGRLDPKKGIENLLHACARLNQRSEVAFSLTIGGAGKPSYTRSLRDRIAALSLTTQVKMIGAVHGEAKRTLFDNADIVLVPSYSENFALVAAEALAHGVPVIASKATPWQGLEENRCGLWVDNDAESLAGAIERLSASPLNEMGQRGREWMKREFSWRERAQDMIHAYEGCLRGQFRLAPQTTRTRFPTIIP